MFRLFFSFLISACLLSAATVCPDSTTFLSVSQSGFGMKMTWDNPTDNIEQVRLRITDNATWTAEETYTFDTNDSADGTSVQVNNLNAATAYLVDIGLYDGTDWSDYTGCQAAVGAISCTGFSSNCDNAVDADGGGAGTDDILEVTTAAGDGTPAAPIAPTNRSFTDITSIDNSVTVTVNGSDQCTNLNALMESQQTAMDAAGSNLVYGVKIPATIMCQPEHETSPLDYYSCPVVTDSTNTLLIYSEYEDTDAHSPFGGMIDPEGSMGGILLNSDTPTAVSLLDCNASGTQNIRFRRLKIGVPDFTTLNYPLITVNSVSSATPPVMTLSTSISADQYTAEGTNSGTVKVRVPNMQGRWFHGGNHPAHVGSAASLWTLSGTSATPGQSYTDGGSTGTGIMHRRLGANFTSATKVSEPVLTFGSDHGYGDGFEYSLTSISSGVATIASGTHNDKHHNGFRTTLLVEGSTGGCDGLYRQNAVTSTTWTLEGAPTGCTGGTIRMVHVVMLHHMTGPSYDQASCVVTFETTTTAKVLYCTDGVNSSFVPDWTSASGTPTGWLSYDPPSQAPLVNVTDCTNCEFEQVFFDGGSLPWRTVSLISATGTQGLVIQGFEAKTSYWQPTGPVTGTASGNSGEVANSYERFIEQTSGDDTQIINGNVETCGFTYQSQNSSGYASPTDITFDGVRVYVPEYCDSENEASKGAVSGVRHHVAQWKGGVMRAKFNGISLAEGVQDTVTKPIAIYAEIFVPANETGGVVRGVSDIEITNSFFDAPAVFAFGAGNFDSNGSQSHILHYTRFALTNNVFLRSARLGNPTNEWRNDAFASTGFLPDVLGVDTGGELEFSNNTILWPQLGSNTAWNPIAELDGAYMSVVKWDANVYVVAYASVGTYGKFRCGSGSNTWANCPAAKFTQLGTAGLSPDADFTVNKIVAGFLAANGTQDPDAANNACTSVETEWDDSAGDNGYATYFPVDTCSNGDSANDRMTDAGFTVGSLDTSGSEGATIIDILRAQGRITDVVHKVTSGSIVLTYEAPEQNGACRAVATAGSGANPSAAATVFAADDVPGAYSRTATITGLAASTTYSYRIACSGGVIVRGEVTTGS